MSSVKWRRGGKDECSDVTPSHSYSVQMQRSRAEPAYCNTAADDWPDPTQTVTPHAESLRKLSKMLLAGNHWVSPLSLLCAPLSVSVCCVLHPSNFIYLLCSPPSLWNGQCALRLRHFSNLSLSMPRTYTAPLSLPFFAFFPCVWAEAGADPRRICILAQSQTWLQWWGSICCICDSCFLMVCLCYYCLWLCLDMNIFLPQSRSAQLISCCAFESSVVWFRLRKLQVGSFLVNLQLGSSLFMLLFIIESKTALYSNSTMR